MLSKKLLMTSFNRNFSWKLIGGTGTLSRQADNIATVSHLKMD